MEKSSLPITPFALSAGAEPIDSNDDAIHVGDTELFIRKTFETNPEKGYQLLFQRYYRPLCSHAVRFVYSKEIAEDLVVDIFTQIWQKQLYQTITTSYRAYLFTSVRRAALAHLNSEFGRRIVGDNWLETDAHSPSTPHQLLQYNELSLKIEAVVRSLAPQCQRVFIMSRFEGKKNALIASELNISIKTVEGHITRVLAILRQALREYGFMLLAGGVPVYLLSQGLRRLISLVHFMNSTL